MKTRVQQVTTWLDATDENRMKLCKEIDRLILIKKAGEIREKRIGSLLKIAVFITTPDLLR